MSRLRQISTTAAISAAFQIACSGAPGVSGDGDGDSGVPTGGTTAGLGSGGQFAGVGGSGVGANGAGVGGNGVGSGGFGTGGNGSGGTVQGVGGTGSGDCAGPTPGSSGENPLLTEIFTADPAVLVHNCTFYITAGHDEGTTGFNLNDWYVLSSTDMVNWSYNGGPKLDLDVFAWANANAWASQMVERNGKFYWYVPINQSGGAMTIGVAVGDSPLGPFTDAIGGPLINDQVEMEAFDYDAAHETVYTIDPTVFVDDDGQAYLMYGGFGRMVTVRLGDDMISLEGDMVESTPPGFFEAPYLTKRGDKYYLLYAAGINPASIDYVMADNPMGPWTGRKQILAPLGNHNGQDAATSHPAVAEFAGQWYLVYHLSDGPGGGTYKRQVAVDKLEFNSDGTIEAVTPSDGLTF